MKSLPHGSLASPANDRQRGGLTKGKRKCMGTKRITEIEILKHETLVIRTPSGGLRPLCQLCDGTRTMITPDEAGVIAGISLRHIFRWVETALVHFSETPAGQIYVCANSLPLAAEVETSAQRS